MALYFFCNADITRQGSDQRRRKRREEEREEREKDKINK